MKLCQKASASWFYCKKSRPAQISSQLLTAQLNLFKEESASSLYLCDATKCCVNLVRTNWNLNKTVQHSGPTVIDSNHPQHCKLPRTGRYLEPEDTSNRKPYTEARIVSKSYHPVRRSKIVSLCFASFEPKSYHLVLQNISNCNTLLKKFVRVPRDYTDSCHLSPISYLST